MVDDVKKIERLYDEVAREYAEAFSGEHEKKPMDREVLRVFAREVGNKRPIWDLGCGPGQTSQFLKDLGLEVSGLDLSEKMLEQARKLHPGISFRKGDILTLDCTDNSVAGVVAFYAIVHFTEEEVRRALHEIFRVLRPGGLFLFTYHVGDEAVHVGEFLGRRADVDLMLFTEDFISGCLVECGFERVETIERGPYPGVEYESRRAYVFARKPVANNMP